MLYKSNTKSPMLDLYTNARLEYRLVNYLTRSEQLLCAKCNTAVRIWCAENSYVSVTYLPR